MTATSTRSNQAIDKFEWHKRYGQSDVPAKARSVAYLVWDHADAEGANAYPGIDGLAKAIKADERTVRRHLTANVAAGWLVLVSNGSNSGRSAKASVYRLAYPQEHRTPLSSDREGTTDNPDRDTGQPCPRTPDNPVPLTDPLTNPETNPLPIDRGLDVPVEDFSTIGDKSFLVDEPSAADAAAGETDDVMSDELPIVAQARSENWMQVDISEWSAQNWSKLPVDEYKPQHEALKAAVHEMESERITEGAKARIRECLWLVGDGKADVLALAQQQDGMTLKDVADMLPVVERDAKYNKIKFLLSMIESWEQPSTNLLARGLWQGD